MKAKKQSIKSTKYKIFRNILSKEFAQFLMGYSLLKRKTLDTLQNHKYFSPFEDFLGTFNDGHRISKTKTKRIASKLRKLLKSGDVDAYKVLYDRHQSQLPEDSWDKSYPFNVDNVREFERFCDKSGGFEIW